MNARKSTRKLRIDRDTTEKCRFDSCKRAYSCIFRNCSWLGVSVAQLSEQAPFTSEFVGWILATDSCEKSQSTLCRKSLVFSGRSGFLPQGKLTGWVRINMVRKVTSQLL